MSSGSSSSNPLGGVKCGCGERAPLRTALTEPNVGRRFLGCVNYKAETGCNFFEWVDPNTCPRGKEFGIWIVKKKIELEKENAELKAKIREFKLREEWLSVKLNSMYRNMNEMEDEHALKMEEWKNKFDWNELEMEELRLQVNQLEETNVGLTMQVQQDMGLSKKNKEMKEEVQFARFKVNVLTAIVVVCIVVMCVVVSLPGKGVMKNKMLALP